MIDWNDPNLIMQMMSGGLGQQAAGMGQYPTSAPNVPQVPQQAPQQMPQAGGIDWMNPLLGAGLGMLSAGYDSRVNPFQAALGGMSTMQAMRNRSDLINERKESLKMEREAAKNEADRRLQTSKLAQEGLKTIDVDNDGNISAEERNRAMLLRIAAQSGDPQYIKAAGEAIKGQTTLAQNLQGAGLVPGTPEYQTAMREAVMKPQVSLDMSTQKALGADAVKWRNSAGEPPSPLLTVEQAASMGFTPRSNDEIKAIESTKQIAGTMGAMVDWGIGLEGDSLFPPDNAGSLERMWGGVSSRWTAVTEDPNHPDLIQYTKTKDATLSALAKMVGQVGQLTDRDVNLVSGLWPKPGFTPRSVAIRQFKTMAKLLEGKGLSEKNLVAAGFPEWVFSDEAPTQDAPDDLPGRN